MPKSNIEQEIVGAMKLKNKVGEKRDIRLARIVNGIGDMEDSDWDNLSEEAQSWLSAGAKAVEKKKAIKDFPDMGGDEEAEEAEEEETPKKRGRPAKIAPAPAKKRGRPAKAEKAEPEPAKKGRPVVKAKVVKEKGPRGPLVGAKVEIKKLVLEDLTISQDDLRSAMKKKGVPVSDLTVQNISTEFKHSLKFLKDQGYLKNIDI